MNSSPGVDGISGLPTIGEIEKAFAGFEIFYVSPERSTSLYSFDESGLEPIADFAGKLKIPAVFIERKYLDKKELRIEDAHYMGLPLEILGGVQLDSHLFNRDLESMDLSEPLEIRIFVLYEGRAFGALFRNENLMPLTKITPEERVAEFAARRRERKRTQTIISVKKEDPLHERFTEILVLDRMYRELTTDSDRINYVMKIARRPGNDSLRKSVYKEDGKGFSMELLRKIVAMTVSRMDVDKVEHKQMVFDKTE